MFANFRITFISFEVAYVIDVFSESFVEISFRLANVVTCTFSTDNYINYVWTFTRAFIINRYNEVRTLTLLPLYLVIQPLNCGTKILVLFREILQVMTVWFGLLPSIPIICLPMVLLIRLLNSGSNHFKCIFLSIFFI